MSTENPNAVMSEQGVLLQDRTVGGVELKAGSTPTERFQALAKAIETGTFAPRHNGAGPPLGYQTRATEQRLVQGERQAAPGTIAGKAAPPSPKANEAANKPDPNRIAEFDAEMRAAGKQITPQPRDASGRFASVPPDQVDANLIDALNKAFAALTPAERDAKRVLYNYELSEAYQGRRLGEPREAWIDRRARFLVNGESVPANVQRPTAPAPTAAPGWQAHVQDNEWVPLDKLTLEDTHGFTVPRFVANQRLHTSTFDLFKQAKAAGISQAQVDSVMHQQAKNMGWVKN